MTAKTRARLEALERANQPHIYIGKPAIEELAMLEEIIEYEVAAAVVLERMSKHEGPAKRSVPDATLQARQREDAEAGRLEAKKRLERLKYLCGLSGEAWEAYMEQLVRNGFERAQNQAPQLPPLGGE